MEELRKIIREQLERLEEDGPSRMSTNTFGIVNGMTKKDVQPKLGMKKVLDIRSTGQGTALLFRHEDGNAYEVTVRPAAYAVKGLWGNLIKKNQDKPLKGFDDSMNRMGDLGLD